MAALREVFARFSTQFQTTQLERGEAQIERVTASLGRLGLALGVGLAVRATANFVDGIREAGDDLDKTGIILGASTQALQQWRFAANLAGVQAGDMTNSTIRLQRMMSDAANGMAAPREAFEDLGISVTDAQGDLKRLDDFMPEFADAIARVENPAERVGTLNRLMGRSGARLGPLFAQGAAGLREAGDEFERLGGGLSQGAIDASVELTDAYARLDIAFRSLKSTIGLFIIPILTRLTDTLSNFLADTEKVEAMKVVLGALATVITVQLAPALLVLTQRLVAFLVPWAPVIAAAALLYLVFEDLFTAMNGGKSLFNDLTEALEGFFEANRNGTGVLGTVSRTWERMVRLMERGFAIVNAITSGDSSILENFDASQRPGARRRGGGSVGILADGTTTTIPRRAAGTAAGGSEVTQTNNTTINTGADQAAVERALERTNRRAVENLEQRVAR